MTPRESAKKEAEVTYLLFLKTSKWVFVCAFVFLLLVTRCNFGVDGTGSKYDPYWIEQYEENMKAMSEKYKK